MTEKSVFISSCSRRQLARRRPARGALRRGAAERLAAGWPPAVLVAAAGLTAFFVGRGGI
ncbi:MAG TPA: hypothetical protein VLP43_02640 [Solirubrobacteraceae bacterium]|nr:hypothetical protein [Solirubrobacteraceae bacterium]